MKEIISPDTNLMTKIWVPSEKAYFYFKKEVSEAKIMERLKLYKARNKYFG